MSDDKRPEAFLNRLGAIYLPSNPGTPVGKFDFLVNPELGRSVQIGTAIAADTQEGVVVGAVVDMRTVGDAQNPLAADMAANYNERTIARSVEVMIATVQVMHSESMRPVRAGIVRAATPEEMLRATGFYDMKWTVPAGVVPLVDGSFAKVCFDGYALLGPESSHLNVSGLSGVAAKSSFVSVLMKSAIEAGDQHNDSVAALVFNVKGEDLIWLDQPPAKGYELSEEDFEIYRTLGVEPKPFDDVTVYAPAMPSGHRGTRSPRPDAQRLSWDLPTVWPYLRYFFSGDFYGDEKLQSFLNEFRDLKLNARVDRVDTFKKLEDWMDQCIAEASGQGEDGVQSSMAWRSHHIASFRRFKRMLTGIPSRAGGLVTVESSPPGGEDVPVKNWTHGQVVVIDIAGLTPDIQAVVIARTLDRLMKSAEEGTLGVEHLIVSFDELNNFAPSTGSEMAQVRKSLERVSSMGRYLGISLWGAGQALSKVAEQVVTNAATRALGRTADIELATGTYGRLSAGLTERIATLPKGQMCLWHYTFRAPLVVRFPRPAWKTGKAKNEAGSDKPRRPKTTDALGLNPRSVARLTEGIHEEMAESIIAGAASAEDARKKLEKARIPDMNQQVVKPPASTIDPANPFDLGEL